MASRANGSADDAKQLTAELGKTLEDRERLLIPTRRPDGTLRKPIRIRAGYVPQDEVAIYQSKGALWKKEKAAVQEVPPGYDPVVETKSKSKSAWRNERKKEKRQQLHEALLDCSRAALEKDENSEENDILPADCSDDPEDIVSVASKMNGLSLSRNDSLVTPPSESTKCSAPTDQAQDIDKKIRALKKKIRLTESQQQKMGERELKPEQLEKVAKLEGWRNELKLLEDKKAQLAPAAPTLS